MLAGQQGQGRRPGQRAADDPRPAVASRPVVRSDSVPATGLEIIATAALTPVTQPSRAPLCAELAIAWTSLGSTTLIGPK